VFYQLAVPVLFAAIGALLAGLVISNWLLVIGGALLLTFNFLFFTWFVYLARERGARFALLAVLFQPVDVSAVGAGMLAAVVEFGRGRKY
jgi:hypothetical protein